MGSEFVDFQVMRLFKNLSDVRQIVDGIKRWEHISSQILKQKHYQDKYNFIPLETHQALVYLGMRQGTQQDRPQQELQQPNNVSISDDEGNTLQIQIEQSFGEVLRFYDRNEIQEIIQSEESLSTHVSPLKEDGDFWSRLLAEC